MPNTVQCHYYNVATFLKKRKCSQLTPHSSFVRARYGVCFVSSKSDLWSAVLYVLYFKSEYNGCWCPDYFIDYNFEQKHMNTIFVAHRIRKIHKYLSFSNFWEFTFWSVNWFANMCTFVMMFLSVTSVMWVAGQTSVVCTSTTAMVQGWQE